MNQQAARDKKRKEKKIPFRLQRWLKATFVLIASGLWPRWMFLISDPKPRALQIYKQTSFTQSTCLPRSLPGYGDPERAILYCFGSQDRTRQWLRKERAGEKKMGQPIGTGNHPDWWMCKWLASSTVIISMKSKRKGYSPPLRFCITPSNSVGISLSCKMAFDVELSLISPDLKNTVQESRCWGVRERGSPFWRLHSQGWCSLTFLTPGLARRWSGSGVCISLGRLLCCVLPGELPRFSNGAVISRHWISLRQCAASRGWRACHTHSLFPVLHFPIMSCGFNVIYSPGGSQVCSIFIESSL